MAAQDRELKAPLVAVATSVTSGLALAVLTKAFQAGLSADATVLWSGVASLGVAAVSWTGFATLRRRTHTAFLMTSAFKQKYFLAELVQQVQNALDKNNIEMVLKVPVKDYDASAQSHNLLQIQHKKRSYIGGIITAADVANLTDDLGKSRPHVLIIASEEHHGRQQRCAEALEAALPDVQIETNEKCAFERPRAYRAVRDHLGKMATDQCLDAIFCTNDEMALGAVDALHASPSAATSATVVVGVDGVLEAQQLIRTGGSPLRATVVQDTDVLARNAVNLLVRMCDGDTVPKRALLPPEVYEG
jgi:ribose transport system substrate-binding protein